LSERSDELSKQSEALRKDGSRLRQRASVVVEQIQSVSLKTNPATLHCPFCKAKPNSDCETSAGGFAVHVARIKAAAMQDLPD